jgi:glucose dehydrogenase
MKKPIMLAAAIFASTIAILAQNDWMYFGQDQGSSRYSTLAQINVDNVKNLKTAWTFHTGDKSGFFESTPLVINSVMYFAAANGFYAVDAVTGQQIWKYEATQTTRRGVAYWPGDTRSVSRIIASTGSKLVALDAKTGKLIPDFGDNGFAEMGTTMSSAAAIYKDVLLTQATKPVINAYNARTGKLIWTFNLIAQPDNPANKTWEGNSWENPGGTNVWGFLSVDAERGLLFVPVSMPGGNDYYGGQHHGDNLYGDCVVAIDINTGKLKWYQQLVHHDIWDYDLAAAPALVNVVRNGRTIPAVAEITKMGLMFIFDRTNGTPIFGMEERPVPQTEAPGEKTSPTQPFPLKPAPLAKNSITKDDLQTGISPEHDAYCQQLWDKYHLSNDGPYTPWDVNRDVVVFPGAIGGGNWNGVSFNPKLGLMFTNVMNAGQWGHLEPAGARGGRGGRGNRGAAGGAPPEESDAPPRASGPNYSKVTPEGRRFWDPKTMYSCNKPPWGELIAVKANTGDIAWRVPLGSFEELEKKGLKTGTPSLGGAITTAGNLIFIGATVDGKFRAFDARNGAELWSTKLEAPAHSVPSTYMGRDGKQYVAIAAGGGGFLQSPTADTLIAFTLP